MIFLLCLLSIACGREIEVKVIDEEGKPLEGAEVIVHYVGGPSEEVVKQLTNKNGVVHSRKTERVMRVELKVFKEGYYQSRFRHQHGNALPKDAEGEYRVVLRKIVNPVPMYAKRVNMIFPSLGKEYGFDFEVGDWVKPHGKGSQSDVFFLAEKSFNSMFNYRGHVTVRFPNLKDGLRIDSNKILESVFMSSKQALRDDDYLQKIDVVRGKPRDKNNPNTPLYNYVFRVRSKTGENGNITKSNYGRIMGGLFVAAGSDNPTAIAIRFEYYFNPKINDTSLEFASGSNLFKSLKKDERVRTP